MKVPILKMGVEVGYFDKLRSLGTGVIEYMTSNVNFPSPSPSLATLQAAVNQLSDAITARGTVGHRGSHQDYVDLLVAETNLRNLLKLEMTYVASLVDPDASPLDQKAFLLSSGFGVRKDPEPQGVLSAPLAVRKLVSARYSDHTPKLIWKRPDMLKSRRNVKGYLVYRSLINDFATAELAGTTTNTSFIDHGAPRGHDVYYFVAGQNAAGIGVACDAVIVMIPA